MLVQTSVMEGSCNAVCEALTLGTPVIASRISGLIGTLGDDYPGYFEVGDEAGLASVLWKAETDHAFYDELRRLGGAAARLLTTEREVDAWRTLLTEAA